MDYFLFGNLPSNIVSLIGPFVLIAVGYLVERNFVGRVATFTNSIAVNLAFYGKNLSGLGALELPLIIYLDVGLVMGVIAIIAYEEGRRLMSQFYQLSWLYCSIVAGAVVLFSLSI